MYLHRLSPTRATATFSRCENHLFTGSSLNRKYNVKDKKNELEVSQKNAQTELFENSSWEPQIQDSISCSDNVDKRKIDSTIIQTRGGMPLAIRAKSRIATSLSSRSKNKIREKIFALYNCTSKAKFTFLTLGFINDVTDQTAQKILNKFLTVCRKRYGRFKYIWVAERQEDTKRIHFHMISDKYFNIAEFNALWVLQQYNEKITHPVYTLEQINEAYQDKKLYISPRGKFVSKMQTMLNPVDVKTVKSVNGLSSYLTQYISKNNDSFMCRTWHCSREVSMLFTSTMIHQDLFNDLQNPSINYAVNKSTGEVYEPKVYYSDYAIIIHVLNKSHFHKNLSELNMLNAWMLENLTDKGNSHITDIPKINILDIENIYRNNTTKQTALLSQLKRLKDKQSKKEYEKINDQGLSELFCS